MSTRVCNHGLLVLANPRVNILSIRTQSGKWVLGSCFYIILFLIDLQFIFWWWLAWIMRLLLLDWLWTTVLLISLMANWQVWSNSWVRGRSVLKLRMIHWVIYLILVTWSLRHARLKRWSSITFLDTVTIFILICIINCITIRSWLFIVNVVNFVYVIWYLCLISKIFENALIHDYTGHLDWTSRRIDIDAKKLPLLPALWLKYFSWRVRHLFVELTTRNRSNRLRTSTMLSSESLLFFHFLQSMLLLKVFFYSLEITSLCLCPCIFHYWLLFGIIWPLFFILDLVAIKSINSTTRLPAFCWRLRCILLILFTSKDLSHFFCEGLLNFFLFLLPLLLCLLLSSYFLKQFLLFFVNNWNDVGSLV